MFRACMAAPKMIHCFLSELLYSSEQWLVYEIPVLITGEEFVGSEFFDCRPGVGSAGAVFKLTICVYLL